MFRIKKEAFIMLKILFFFNYTLSTILVLGLAYLLSAKALFYSNNLSIFGLFPLKNIERLAPTLDIIPGIFLAIFIEKIAATPSIIFFIPPNPWVIPLITSKIVENPFVTFIIALSSINDE